MEFLDSLNLLINEHYYRLEWLLPILMIVVSIDIVVCLIAAIKSVPVENHYFLLSLKHNLFLVSIIKLAILWSVYRWLSEYQVRMPVVTIGVSGYYAFTIAKMTKDFYLALKQKTKTAS